jgi:hypothetical protein
LRKIKKKTEFFNELSGSKNQLGSPSDLENEKSTKAGKPNAKRKLRPKEDNPQYGRQFYY